MVYNIPPYPGFIPLLDALPHQPFPAPKTSAENYPISNSSDQTSTATETPNMAQGQQEEDWEQVSLTEGNLQELDMAETATTDTGQQLLFETCGGTRTTSSQSDSMLPENGSAGEASMSSSGSLEFMTRSGEMDKTGGWTSPMVPVRTVSQPTLSAYLYASYISDSDIYGEDDSRLVQSSPN